MSILFILLITILYMWGGQNMKAMRRYGVPFTAFIAEIIRKDNDKKRIKKLDSLYYIVLIAILSMGYGIDSKLGKLCNHKEWLIRVAYATLLSIPIMLINASWYAIPMLLIAYQVRAGSLGHFKIKGKTYDILIEDIVRGLTIGCSIIL